MLAIVKEATKQQGRRLLRPLVGVLSALRIHPNVVTLASVPLSLLGGYFFATGRFTLGGISAALVGLSDTLDGELSRLTGRQSSTGAFLDSVVDRLSEVLLIGGICWYYSRSEPGSSMIAIAALVSSLLVSYVRARAEGLGFECRVGWFERPVRVLVLLFGAFFLGTRCMPVAMALIAAGSLATALHRVLFVTARSTRR